MCCWGNASLQATELNEARLQEVEQLKAKVCVQFFPPFDPTPKKEPTFSCFTSCPTKVKIFMSLLSWLRWKKAEGTGTEVGRRGRAIIR